jgi:Holliday junction resolvase
MGKWEVITIPAEKTFENKVKKFLDSQGAWYVKFFANSFTKSGIPDILACVNGYFVGVEVKAQNGTPSELQLYNVKKIREAGGFAMVLYPSGFNKFKAFILDLKQEVFNVEMEEVMK